MTESAAIAVLTDRHHEALLAGDHLADALGCRPPHARDARKGCNGSLAEWCAA